MIDEALLCMTLLTLALKQVYKTPMLELIPVRQLLIKYFKVGNLFSAPIPTGQETTKLAP